MCQHPDDHFTLELQDHWPGSATSIPTAETQEPRKAALEEMAPGLNQSRSYRVRHILAEGTSDQELRWCERAAQKKRMFSGQPCGQTCLRAKNRRNCSERRKKGKEVADHQNMQQASAVSVNENSKDKLGGIMQHFLWPQLSGGDASGLLVDITSSEPVVASSSLGYFLSHQTALCVGDLVFVRYRSNVSHISEGTRALCGRTRLLRPIVLAGGRHMGVWTPGNRSRSHLVEVARKVSS